MRERLATTEEGDHASVGLAPPDLEQHNDGRTTFSESGPFPSVASSGASAPTASERAFGGSVDGRGYNTGTGDDEAPRHADRKNGDSRDRPPKSVAQASPDAATVAHQSSDAESINAALSALEHYATVIDPAAKHIITGSASTGPGPLENMLLDNLNGVRDLTDHISAYLKGLGVAPATLQKNDRRRWSASK